MILDAAVWEGALAQSGLPIERGPGPILSPSEVAELIASVHRARSPELRSLVAYLREHGREGLSLCFRRS
jgi:hypothetical protein